MTIMFRTKIKSVPSLNSVFNATVPKLKRDVDTNGFYSTNNIPILVCPECEGDDQIFEDNQRFFFYVPYVSGRVIEVWREDESMCVAIPPLTDPVTFYMAMFILESFKQNGATKVTLDDNEPLINIDDAMRTYDPKFFKTWSRMCLREILTKFDEYENTSYVILAGPLTEFHFGNIIASVLGVSYSDDDVRLDILWDMMKKNQFWAISSNFDDVVKTEIKNDDDGTKCAYIKPNQRCFVPKVDKYAFEYSGDWIEVSKEDLYDKISPEWNSNKFRMMDEFHLILDLSEDDNESIAVKLNIPTQKNPTRYNFMDYQTLGSSYYEEGKIDRAVEMFELGLEAAKAEK